MRRKSAGILIIALLVVGAWQVSQGAWIYIKAEVGQYLLQQAWSKTTRGHRHIKPWPWADTWPVARLHAPRQKQDLIVLSGASGRTLAFGPVLVTESVQHPSGTVVISGHRDTHFQFLSLLRPGDPMLVETAERPRTRYRVSAIEVIDSRTTGLVNDPDRDQLILITCYPFDAVIPGGPLRYVVIAERTKEEKT